MKGWRTRVVGLGFVACGVVLLLENHTEVGMSLVVSGLTFSGLRAVTTGPLGKE